MDYYIGTIAAFAFSKVPDGWLPCNGASYSTQQYTGLAIYLNFQYGGSFETEKFNVPDLRGKIYMSAQNYSTINQQGGHSSCQLNALQLTAHNHTITANMITDGAGNIGTEVNPSGNYLSASLGDIYIDNAAADGSLKIQIDSKAVITSGNAGQGQPFSNIMPSLALNYCICADGLPPTLADGQEPFAGMIAPFGYYYNSNYLGLNNYLPCQGQLLPIKNYLVLYAALGTMYGGDGNATFGLPNLNNRTPIGAGQAPGLQNYPMGSHGGSTYIELTPANLPTHTHTMPSFGLPVSSGTGNSPNPVNSFLASSNTPQTGPIYTTKPVQPTQYPGMSGVFNPTGNSSSLPALDITNPYIMAPYMIAINGIFPARQ